MIPLLRIPWPRVVRGQPSVRRAVAEIFPDGFHGFVENLAQTLVFAVSVGVASDQLDVEPRCECLYQDTCSSSHSRLGRRAISSSLPQQ